MKNPCAQPGRLTWTKLPGLKQNSPLTHVKYASIEGSVMCLRCHANYGLPRLVSDLREVFEVDVKLGINQQVAVISQQFI